MKIRFDGSSFIEVDTPSGVGHYSRLLYQALSENNSVELTTGPFFSTTSSEERPGRYQTKANKIYRKLASHGSKLPFDSNMSPVDLTVFPNFARLPTTKSKLSAVTIHDLTYLRFPELVESKNLAFLRRVVPAATKQADFIITVSEAVKRELIEEFSLASDSIVVTPIPVDPIYLSAPSVDINHKYKLPNKKYILFIGNLEPRKNLITLVKAYQLLPREIRDEYALILAGGNGWNTAETETTITEAQKNGADIHHIGYIDQADAPSLYRQSSLLALPSLYEGFGMQIMEAFATNTPVVAADIPVLREVSAGGALLADPQDPAKFAEAIETALTDSDLAAKLKRAAESQLNSISWQKNSQIIVSKATQLL